MIETIPEKDIRVIHDEREYQDKMRRDKEYFTTQDQIERARNYYLIQNNKEGDQAAAEWITNTYHTISEATTDRLYVYNPENGYYEKAGYNYLKAILTREFNKHMTRTRILEVLSKVSALSYKDLAELEKTIPPHLIPLQNGIYDLQTGKLLPHSPSYFFTYKHPVTYNPNIDCPNIKNFLRDIVEGDDAEILIDIAALCYYRAKLTRHFFILVGDGHNGKSVYLNLLRDMIGHDRVVSITPQNLERNTFTSSQLYDKHADLGADIPGGFIRDLTIVKSVTGNDAISIEFKGKDRFEAHLYTEIVYSSNTPPRFEEDTRAIWDRLVTVTFPFTFTEKPEKKNEKQANLKIEEEIGSEDEHSGFLSLVLLRLAKLVKTRKLTKLVNPEEMRARYHLITNSPQAFLHERCEQAAYIPGLPQEASVAGWVAKADLYAEYRLFCLERSLKIESVATFARRIKEVPGWAIEDGRESLGSGERVLSYRNIVVKPAKNEVVEPSELSPKSPILFFTRPLHVAEKGISVTGHPDLPGKITAVQDLPTVIRTLEERGIPPIFERIKELWQGSESTLKIALEVLVSRGDLYSPQPDEWRVP